jgi:hypothetical protein
MRIVFAVLAIGLQGGGGYALWLKERWIASSATVEGTVVSVERSQGRKGRSTYREVVRFTAADGTEHEFTESMGSSHPYAKGETVAVRYQPSNPADAAIATTVRLWIAPALLVLVGIACAAGAFFTKAGVVEADSPAPSPHDGTDAAWDAKAPDAASDDRSTP